jgi:hypothetical protein
MRTWRSVVTVVLGTSFAAGGCASATPEARAAFGVYWSASRECEQQYRTLHIRRVYPNGDLTVSADHDILRDLAAFTQCYHEGIGSAVARHRQSGQPLPDTINQNPGVDVD